MRPRARRTPVDLADEPDALGLHLDPGGDDVVDLEPCDRRHHEFVAVGDAFGAEYFECVAILGVEDGEVFLLELQTQAEDVAREGDCLDKVIRWCPEPANASDLHPGCIRSTRSIELAFPV